MPTLKVANAPIHYMNGSPATRAFEVLVNIGMRNVEVEVGGDDEASLTYELPPDFEDPMDVEERLRKVGLLRVPLS